jgi:hypothetical protein
MKDRSIEIGVEVFLVAVCSALGIGLWGFLIAQIGWTPVFRRPYLWASGLMFIINAGHYTWEALTVDDDFSDIPADGLMMSWYDFHRVLWRTLALLTVGPSIHLRRAVGLLRSPSEE